MNVIVVATAVPAIGLEIQYDPWLKGVDRDDIVLVPSNGDLRAVAEAVKLSGIFPQGIVTILAAGPLRIETVLRDYLAAGADEALRIQAEHLENYDAFALADMLVQAIKSMEYDLILCSNEIYDEFGCDYCLGPYLAEMLGLPQVTGVTRIELPPRDDRLTVHRKLERGNRQIVRLQWPALFTLDTEPAEINYPSLPAVFAAVTKPIKLLSAQDFTISGASTSRLTYVTGLSPRKTRAKKGLVVETSLSASDRLKLVMASGQSVKNTRQVLLTGNSDKLADSIIIALQNQGVIKKTR